MRIAKLDLLENDERFKLLSYNEQVELRARLLEKVFTEDPELSKMSAREKAFLVRRISFKEPIYENNIIAQRMNTITSQYKNYDPEKDSQILSLGTMGKAKVNPDVVQKANRMAFSQSMAASSSVFQTIYKTVGDWAAKTFDLKDKDGLLLTYENLYGSDYRKGMEYLSYLANEDEQKSKMLNIMQTLGGASGLVADLTSFYRTTGGGLPTKFIDTIGSKIASNIGVKALASKTASGGAARIGQWFFKTFAPNIARATGEGIVWTIRDQIRKVQGFEDATKSIAQSFGEGAAYDYLFGIGLSVAGPFLKLAGRTFFKGFFKNETDLAKIARQYGVNKDELFQLAIEERLPGELLRTLSPRTQDSINMGHALIQAGKNSESLPLRPIDKTYLDANRLQVTMAQLDDGTFRLRDNLDLIRKYEKSPTKVDLDTHVLKNNISGVKEELSKIAWRELNLIENTDQRISFLKKNEDLLVFESTRHNIQKIFDPLESIEDAATSNKMKRSIEKGNYIPAYKRSAIHNSEAIDYLSKIKDRGEFADTFTINMTDNMMSKVRKGKNIFDIDNPIILNKVKGHEGNLLLTLRKPVDMRSKAGSHIYNMAEEMSKKILLKSSDSLNLNLAQTTRYVLKNHGYDGIIHNTNQVESFFPSEVKYITDNIDLNTGTWKQTLRKSSFQTQGEIRKQAQIQSIVESKIKIADLKKNPDLLTNVAVQKFSGKLKSDDIRKFTRAYLSGTKADISDIKVNLGSKSTSVDNRGGKVTINAPREIIDQASQEEFVTNLLDGLQEVHKKSVGSKAKIKTFDASEIYASASNKYRSPLPGNENQLKWLDDIARNNLSGDIKKLQDGRYILRSKGMAEPTIYNSIEDLNDAVLKRTIDKGILKVDIHSKGYKLIEDQGTLIVKGKDNKILFSGRTTEELLDNMNYRPDKIDEVYSPKVVSFTDNNEVVVRYVDGELYGDRKSISQFMSKFRDYNKFGRFAKRAASKNGDMYYTPQNLYRVIMPKAGIIEEFDNLKDARNFLTKEWKANNNLRKIATKKGLGFYQEGSVYNFYDGNVIHKASTTEEIESIFRQYPDIEGGPPILTAEIEDIADEVTKVIKPDPDGSMIKPADFFSVYTTKFDGDEIKPSIGLINYLRQYTSNTDEFFRKVTERIGDQELMRRYRAIETSRRAAFTKIRQSEELIEDIWQNAPGGSLIGKKNILKREAIFAAYQETDRAKQLKILSEAGVSEQTGNYIFDRVKKFFGSNEHEGLFAISRIDPNKFITDYLPHLRKQAYQMSPQEINNISALEFGQKTFKSNRIPKELKFWAENERISDLIEMSMEKDPLMLMTKYSDKMYKKLYMNDAWQNLYQYAKQSSHKLPPELIERLNVYRDTLMSTYYSNSEKSVRKFGEEFARGLQSKKNNLKKLLGKDDIDVDPETIRMHGDWSRRIFSLNYLTNMGFRPWLPIRNMFQIYTTLAPRFGFSNVNRAMKLVSEGGEETFDYLNKTGIITGKAPLINTIADLDSKLGKATRKGLEWFKNSDEMTRAVAALTAKVQWDDAVSAARKGEVVNPEAFKILSGVNLIDPADGDEIMRLFLSSSRTPQNADAALNIYQNRVVEDTMFGYRVSNAPQLNRNFVGRLFGQYGTYSAGYRANLSRGLSYGTRAQKAAFIGRLMVGSTAIYAAMRAIGIDEKSFLPLVPSVFTGGPMFDLALNGLRSMDVTSYRGQIARSEFSRGLRGLAPGSSQLRSLQRFLDHNQEGNPWAAWLALTSAPVKPID